MFKNKKMFRIINLILCFSIFFSLINVIYAGVIADAAEAVLETAKGVLIQIVSDRIKLIAGVFAELLVALGDGVVHIVTRSVGESVTIDKLIFGDIKKLNIDFWNETGIESVGSAQTSLKSFMTPVINKWYKVFFNIALIVYMITLVFIGISIVFTSTAEKKSNYEERLVSWVMGITILFMFPYVMKYIVLLNNSFVKALQAKSYELGYGEAEVTINELAKKNFFEIAEYYGQNGFINLMKGLPADAEVTEDNINDTMLIVRYAALKGEDITESDLFLAIVYLILIGQMLAVLLMYYKRTFMVAFLITIFPLVAMTYVLDKMRRRKKSIV